MSRRIAKSLIGFGLAIGIAGAVIAMQLIVVGLSPEPLWIVISATAVLTGYLLCWWGGRTLRNT